METLLIIFLVSGSTFFICHIGVLLATFLTNKSKSLVFIESKNGQNNSSTNK